MYANFMRKKPLVNAISLFSLEIPKAPLPLPRSRSKAAAAAVVFVRT